jgi:Effector-associated domain 7
MSWSKLRRLIEDHLNLEELQTLCFDLNIDYDSLPRAGKPGKVQEIIALFRRSGQVPDLIAYLINVRPTVAWNDLRFDDPPASASPPEPASPPPLAPVNAKEIERKQHLLDLVAEKIGFFEQQKLLITDPNTQFQLETQLAELRSQRKMIETEIKHLRDGNTL